MYQMREVMKVQRMCDVNDRGMDVRYQIVQCGETERKGCIMCRDVLEISRDQMNCCPWAHGSAKAVCEEKVLKVRPA